MTAEDIMHELTIVNQVLDAIEKEAVKRGLKRVKSAKLEIGKMNAFQKGDLELALLTTAKSKVLEGVKFNIIEVPVKLSCSDCGHSFVDERFNDNEFAHNVAHAPAFYIPPPCPSCSSQNLGIVSGKELKLVEMV